MGLFGGPSLVCKRVMNEKLLISAGFMRGVRGCKSVQCDKG